MSNNQGSGLLFETPQGNKADEQKAVVNVSTQPQQLSMLEIMNNAITTGAGLDAIKVMADLLEKERNDQRRMAFDAAMAQAQSEMLRIAPDGNNPQTHSRYATYATLDRAIRPIYTRYGFGLSFNTIAGAVPEMVRVTCHVSHRDGWGRDYEIDMPADGLGAKGGAVMSKTHAAGSAVTYGRRYLLMMIFNLAIGQDDDGNMASGKATITQEQAEELKNIAQNVGVQEAKIVAAYGVNSIDAIPASMFEPAKKQLLRKINGGAK